ncbi:hypothetical protein ALC62_03617, partial [Cyphomyrmex costatus]
PFIGDYVTALTFAAGAPRSQQQRSRRREATTHHGATTVGRAFSCGCGRTDSGGGGGSALLANSRRSGALPILTATGLLPNAIQGTKRRNLD